VRGKRMIGCLSLGHRCVNWGFPYGATAWVFRPGAVEWVPRRVEPMVIAPRP
jgi:hypothetical protein